jgi:hypothetical protein
MRNPGAERVGESGRLYPSIEHELAACRVAVELAEHHAALEARVAVRWAARFARGRSLMYDAALPEPDEYGALIGQLAAEFLDRSAQRTRDTT